MIENYVLEAQNICKKLEDNYTIKNISLKIPTGAVTSLIGPSGSGKTTCLKILSGILKPDTGNVYFNGESIKDLAGFYPSVGVVSQEFKIWPHLSVENNITLAPKEQKCFDKNLYEQLIEDLCITNITDRHANKISGGQRQRVALARSLCMKPKLLFLDEITASQDIQNIERIASLIKKAKHTTSIFLVTHALKFAENVSDQIIFISEDGDIAEQGTKDILKNPTSKKLKNFLQYN